MDAEIETKNAEIRSTMLGREGHGIFTYSIHLDFGGSGQGCGGYALDEPLRDEKDKFVKRVGTAFGMQQIIGLLDCLEVDDWESLVGQKVRVLADISKVHRIGHILKDRWFTFGEPKNPQVI